VRFCWLVAFAIVATWLGALAAGLDVRAPGPGELIALGGNWAPRTRGEPWRLVSSAFVHAGFLHLALNVVGLVVVGTLVERRLGTWATVAVLGGSIVVAAAASLVASPYAISVGASGAVAGLCGALVVALLREREAARADRTIAIVAVIAFLAWGSTLAATTDGVDHAAHLGGLVTGAAIAWLARPALGLGLALVATAALVSLAPAPVDVRAIGADVIAIERRYDAILAGVGYRADGPRLAATLDAEVIAPLRRAAARLVVDDRLPPRDLQFARALSAYLAARLRALELHNRYLATGDASVLDQIEAAEAEARAAGALLSRD
jgi:rhomboid protease GluP